jgi:hypothetical protein
MYIKKLSIILLIVFFSCNKQDKQTNHKIESEKTEDLEFEIVKPADLEKNVDDFFKNVSKIELLAYLDRNKWDKLDNPDYRNPNYIKNNKFEIKEKYLRNKIVLTKNQILMLQNGFKEGYYEVAAACYDPRHAIIFYDKNNVIIGNIEICFECNNVSSSKNLYSIGKTASNQLDLFKKFGITYFGEEENN